MPRPPRIDFADAVFHVTCRGNGRAPIFLSDEDNCRFLQQLQDNVETFGVVLYAYFGIDAADLAEHGHRVGLAKFVAVELTCRLAGWNQRAVGQRYGGMSSAAVSTIRRKIREGHYEVTPVIESLLREITAASQGVKVNT